MQMTLIAPPMKKLFTLIAICSLAARVFAQGNVEFTKDNFKDRKSELKEALEHIKVGDQYYEQGPSQYAWALPQYVEANNFNPNNAMLNYKIGLCYIYSAFKWRAQEYLQKAYKLNPAVSIEIHYYLGRAYHLAENWEGAISEYNIYLQTLNPTKQPDAVKDVKKKIQECKDGAELVKNPVHVFIDNIGGAINSRFPDYGPVISADESVMFFTSRRDNSTGGKMVPGTPDYFEDIYVSTNVNGKWSTAMNAGDPINTEGHDATVALNADGTKLFIYLDNKGDGNIWECNQKGNTWSKPDKMSSNINTKYHESSASVTADGRTLYFVSAKEEDSFGGHDIYMSKLDDKGKWGKPVNLGGVINTEYNEESVFIHPDGKTLYFSSQGHKTMGGYDIFKSVFNEKTKTWSTPENIGYPVNSPDDDIDFVLSASGKHGYYSSFKKDGQGEKDIYMITFISEKSPIMSTEDNLLASLSAPVKETVVLQKVDVNAPQLTLLKGVITDQLNKKPLEATIELVDNSKNEVIATFKSNGITGRYLVSLPSGKNYGIAVKCEGYLFHSENFDIPVSNGYQEVIKDIELKNVKVGSKIILKNIFFDFDKATLRQPESTNELDNLIKLLTDVPTMKIEISGHTDSKGSDSYNLTLSQNRAQAVVDYLVNHGIAKDRLKATGYGETKPIDSNDTDEGRQNNRRTEFEILSK
jgi:outer membrane protein OmpA-like peptidoglycan-associated protein/tetratricopeptide (TPR) repeat protein